MKWSEAPFTHICEWKWCSPSSSSFGSIGRTLVVAKVALGSASIIIFPPSRFYLESESTSESKAFSSATCNFLEWHYSLLCQGILWYSHHFIMSFFIFSLPLLCYGLDWLSWEWPSLLYPLLCGLGLPLHCFDYEKFADPNSRLFCLNFYSILTTYL